MSLKYLTACRQGWPTVKWLLTAPVLMSVIKWRQCCPSVYYRGRCRPCSSDVNSHFRGLIHGGLGKVVLPPSAQFTLMEFQLAIARQQLLHLSMTSLHLHILNRQLKLTGLQLKSSQSCLSVTSLIQSLAFVWKVVPAIMLYHRL